jgi:arylformamidase
MIASITLDQFRFQIDLSAPINIAQVLRAGKENANCFWADAPTIETITVGDYVGSVADGGTTNYRRISFTPHGNGTHTECIGHITADPADVLSLLHKRSFFTAQLMSIRPTRFGEDLVVTLNDVSQYYDKDWAPEALIIRTMPNDPDLKRVARYSGNNPPYLEPALGEWLVKKRVKHLLLDLPSVDRESDEGALMVHRAFWQSDSDSPRLDATITELILVPNDVTDGRYILQLAWPNVEVDAFPASVLLYRPFTL